MRFTGVGLEAVVSWLPFPVKSNKRLVLSLKWGGTEDAASLRGGLNYLEQSFPIQPGLQWHLSGRMQRPLLRQGEEHTAAGNKEEAADAGGDKNNTRPNRPTPAAALTVVAARACPSVGTLALVRCHTPAPV